MTDYARMVIGANVEETVGVLQFALNSCNVPMGTGSGERMRSADPAHDAEFMALRGMFPVEITVDLASVLFPGSAFAAAHGGERRYSSVEHAFQAAAPRGGTSRSRRAARFRGEHRAGTSAGDQFFCLRFKQIKKN